MNTFISTGITVIAAAGITVGLTAAAVPNGTSQVDNAVRALQADGYHVVVNRVGAAPMSQCTITAVRPGQTHATDDSRGGGTINTTITSRTVYVDVAC
jgi:CMP-2-keto-3-deoxyoctulosonic acid synthetase